jgi:hypothetical protein
VANQEIDHHFWMRVFNAGLHDFVCIAHRSLEQGEFVRNINRALASGVQELEAPPLRHADIPDASSSRMTTHDHAMFLGSHCATREAR